MKLCFAVAGVLCLWAAMPAYAAGMLSEEKLVLEMAGKKRGSITVQRELGELLLPIKPLASLLARELAVSGEGRILTMILPIRQDTLIVDVGKARISKNGVPLSGFNLKIIRVENDLYVSRQALADIFSASIQLHATRGTLSIDPAESLSAEESEVWNLLLKEKDAALQAVAPSEAALIPNVPRPRNRQFPIDVVQDMAPRQAVSAAVDDVSSGDIGSDIADAVKHEAEIAAPAATPKLPAKEAALPEPLPEHETAEAETPSGATLEPLVLQLNVNTLPMVEFIEALDSGKRTYLPMNELSVLLDLAITVDPKKREARGWFLQRENAIVINEHEASIHGKTYALTPEDVRYEQDEFYVSTEKLQEWLPMNFAVNRRDLVLMITAREALPFEQKQQRAERRQLFEETQSQLKTRDEIEQTYIPVNNPYSAFRLPYTDFTTVQGYRDGDDSKREGSYSLLSRGELGYMTSQVFAAGDIANASDELSDLRVSLGRVDPTAQQLGALNAREFSLGDNDSPVLPLVTRSSLGRGVRISNRTLDRTDTFDTTSFIGNSTPGFEAELYRNDVLVDFQTIGSNGRYEFRDVPVLFGINNFRLLLFGPQGQVEEQKFQYATGNALLKEGEFSYNFSADQKAKTVFSVSDTGLPFDAPGIRGIGQVEYGVSSGVTLTTGGARTTLSDGTHDYATGGARASLLGMLTSYDFAQDIKTTAQAHNVGLSTSFGDFSLRGNYRVNDGNYISEEEEILGTPTDTYRDYGVTGPIVLPLIEDLTFDLGVTERAYSTGRDENYIRNRLAKNAYGLNFTNELLYGFADIEQTNGTFSTRGYYGQHLLGGNFNYTVDPDTQLDSITLTDQFPLGKITSNRVQVNQFLVGNQQILLSNTLTFDLEESQLSLITDVQDSGDYFIGIGLNFSFGVIPETGHFHMQNRSFADAGSLQARAYLDENFNQKRDAREQYMPGINYNVGNVRYEQGKESDGFISSLPGYDRVSATVDATSFEDPMLVSGIPGYKAEVRPGTTTLVEFPIQRASEIEGYVQKDGNSEKPLAGAKLQLVNASGKIIRRTISEFDGYYYFEGVMPGNFTVQLDEAYARKKQLRVMKPLRITVDKADFYDDRTLNVTRQ